LLNKYDGSDQVLLQKGVVQYGSRLGKRRND
jgi:hypothetical protein